MKPVLLASIGLVLSAGAAQAQDGAQDEPTPVECAAAYGALSKLQQGIGAQNALMTERYPLFASIDFADRIVRLAGKAEMGVTDLKTKAGDEQAVFYAALINAETEGDMDVKDVADLVRRSNGCDLAHGLVPSLGR